MFLKKTPALSLAIAALCAAAAPAAFAQNSSEGQSNWMVRGRVVQIDTANKSDAVPSLGIPADAIHVSNKAIPELDITYFFTPNIAAELVLTWPQRHRVHVTQSVLGAADLGTFKHLPPTLMVQYHFLPNASIRPYAGIGLNYTRLGSENLFVPTVGHLQLENKSVGLAVGAGVDFQIDKNWFFNIDIKKIQLRSDVRQAGQTISKVRVDPWLFGVGFGYRF